MPVKRIKSENDEKLEARHDKYKKALKRKRREAYEKGLLPLIDNCKGLDENELDEIMGEALATIEVSPVFVNTGAAEFVERKPFDAYNEHFDDDQVQCKTGKNFTSQNLRFLEKYANQRLTHKDAQIFMIQDALRRERPYYRDQKPKRDDKFEDVKDETLTSRNVFDIIDILQEDSETKS